MIFSRIGYTGLVLVVALAWTGVRPASAQNTSIVGGSGGTSFSIRCKSNEVLIGLRVKSGLWTDQIRPQCASGMSISDGGWGGSRTHSSGAGKDHFGTTEKVVSCNQKHAVTGFRVDYGQYVNGITLTCSRLERSWRTTSSTAQLARVGGSTGPKSASKSCGSAMHGVGIRGKAGEYVDAFGLLCGNILPTKPTLQAPVAGLRVSTKRPTFYFNNAAYDLSRTICVNTNVTADCAAPGTVIVEVSNQSDSWTPNQDLPFSARNKAYWSVNACNDNGCKRSNVGDFYPAQ